MDEFIYFGAGPGKLPAQVLERAQNELLDSNGSNLSILEIGHTSPQFLSVYHETMHNVSKLLNIPQNYKILFLQGGGRGQFAAVAMNLIARTGKADYIVTGHWSAEAQKEASKYGEASVVFPKLENYGDIPDPSVWKLDPEASYVFYCDNETLQGVEFSFIPETNGVPLVADMSSNIFSRAFDVSKFGVIFAAAQKNIGPAGVALVIVREDLLNFALPCTPSIWNYGIMAKEDSILYNTPPCMAIYAIGLVLDWICTNGAVEEMERRSIEKSQRLYKVIDNSNGFYLPAVNPKFRSRMNVTFRIKNDDGLEEQFLKEAMNLGYHGLKGPPHLIRGIRASIYNAILPKQVEKLEKFMTSFAAKHQ